MTWVDGVLLLACFLGLVAGGVLVARSPTFWLGLGIAVFQRVKPQIIIFLAYLTRRMPPEEEAAWRQAVRQGRGDEWLRERWRKRRKK